MTSWEDVDMEQLIEKLDAKAPIVQKRQPEKSIWDPCPLQSAPGGDGCGHSSTWHVAYTSHQGRFEAPVVHDDWGELLQSSDGGPLRAAFLSTFYPFELQTLKRF